MAADPLVLDLCARVAAVEARQFELVLLMLGNAGVSVATLLSLLLRRPSGKA